MPLDRRRIIEVFFPLPNGEKIHPAVILSVNEIYQAEGYYICAMITDADKRNDKFSFFIEENDITEPFDKPSQVRTHLVAQIYDEDINKKMPIKYFTTDGFMRLVDHIDEIVFGLPYVP